MALKNGYTEHSLISFEEDQPYALKFSSRRGLILDEASSLFAGLKRDYNTGLAEALMRFYDCGNHSGRTRGRGLAVVKNSYLTFIGATTEISLRQADVQNLFTLTLPNSPLASIPHLTDLVKESTSFSKQ